MGALVDLSTTFPGGAVPHAAWSEPVQRALLQRLVPWCAIHVLQQQLLGKVYRPGGSGMGVCKHRVRSLGVANVDGEHGALHDITLAACSSVCKLMLRKVLASGRCHEAMPWQKGNHRRMCYMHCPFGHLHTFPLQGTSTGRA